MSKATEDQLAYLHGRVAESFTAALSCSEDAKYLLAKERDEPLPQDVMKFLEGLSIVNPSLLTAATKFLKDNSITVDAGSEGGLQKLAESLMLKKQKGKAGKVVQIPFTD